MLITNGQRCKDALQTKGFVHMERNSFSHALLPMSTDLDLLNNYVYHRSCFSAVSSGYEV